MSLDFLRAMRSARTETFGVRDYVSRWKPFCQLCTGGLRSSDSTWQRISVKCFLFLLVIGTLVGFAVFTKHSFGAASTPQRSDHDTFPFNLRRRTPRCSPGDACHFALVADLDLKSKVSDNPLLFKSYLLYGILNYESEFHDYSIQFNATPTELYGNHNEAGRGLELSELIYFQHKLLTFDDRTGIAYEIMPQTQALVPRYVLTAGNGEKGKGMKVEWATEKSKQLWLGSFGKEYTDSSGKVLSEDNFWIAILDASGTIGYRNWKPIYRKLQRIAGVPYPGYLLHEAVAWSEQLQRWIILPRRLSTQPYNETLDERLGTNVLFVATEDFEDVKMITVGEVIPERGFSSFKFIPGSQDRAILATRTVELSETDEQYTFVTAFETLTGKILLKDTRVPFDAKFEGLEFLPNKY